MTDLLDKAVTNLGEDESADPIEEAIEEHGDFDPRIKVGDNKQEVEAQSTEERLDGMFQPPEDFGREPEETRSEDHAYMRSITFVAGRDEVDPDPDNTFERSQEAKERLQEVERVNEELKSVGSTRRYIVNANDAPGDAFVHEDDFGKYYYEAFDESLRPSDIAKYAGVQAWPVLGEDDQVIKTLEVLNEISGEALVDAGTEKAAHSWLDRHMVTPDNDVGDDVFDPDFVKSMAKLLAVTSVSKDEEDDKGNSNEDGST